MARLTLLVVLLILTVTLCHGQQKITWKTLKDVSFSEKYSEEAEAYYYHPEFGTSVKALAGKEVYIKGYFLVMGSKNDFYILSRYPYSSCFFCGSAGPESIIEVNFKRGRPKLQMDERATIKGTLRLNIDDIGHCNYILNNAEVRLKID